MKQVCVFMLCVLGGAGLFPAGLVAEVSYQKDVRKILSNHCYQCHGPDAAARKAKLRLDLEEGAIVELGGKAVSRDDAESSELLARIFTDDPDDIMPPSDINKPLSDAQKNVLKAWVLEGASWDGHWAYVPPVRPEVPRGVGRSMHPVDRFVQARLNEEGIEPSPEAEPVTLVRRLYFDLLGLPPSPMEVDEYLSDRSTVAYARLVEQLLGSGHYGERMAMYWFDLVRFATTSGIHSDNTWDVNPYRSWVIDALNENMPFDQFTRAQLAGDLLPDATTGTRVAATYNRLNLSTREGGSQAKEFVAKYMADRIRNAGSVWLASTLGCAECHDHKFDPVSTREFYQFGAFFSDIEQVGVYGADFPPYLKLPTAEEAVEFEVIDAGLERLKAILATETAELATARLAWEKTVLEQSAHAPEMTTWHSVGPFAAASFDAAFDSSHGPEDGVDLADTYSDGNLRWVERAEWTDGEIHSLSGDNSATYLFREIRSSQARELTLSLGSDDGIIVWLNGEQQLSRKVNRGVAKDQDRVTVKLQPGRNELLMKIVNGGGGYGFFFRADNTPAPAGIVALLKVPPSERSAEDDRKIQEHFLSVTPLLKAERDKLAELTKRRQELDNSLRRTLATVSVEPAMTRVLPRGNWMDDSGEVVQPAVPAVMGGRLETGGGRGSRLDLANWLVSPENPLTARVFVNRLWMLFFGEGLSRSVDDFGAQGESPSHPELLDWLACEFVDSGWDIKHMVRLLVTSDTYKQSSARRRELEQRDPFNRLFARQNRYRINAEMVRDMTLRTSGLLNAKVGGYESAHPYQPVGYYRHLNFPTREYRSDEDENQYRRGVYMHWQRQYLHPALKAFDAPTREECVARRSRSNTPLAALVQMNDPAVMEASRALAEHALQADVAGDDARLTWTFRQVLSRQPTDEELTVLRTLLADQRAEYETSGERAVELLSTGLRSRDEALAPAELAAWSMVARTLLNTHEAILRQ